MCIETWTGDAVISSDVVYQLRPDDFDQRNRWSDWLIVFLKDDIIYER